MQKNNTPTERYRVSLAYRVPYQSINSFSQECFKDEIENLVGELKRQVPSDAMLVSIYVLNISSLKPDANVSTDK